ncbi:cytidine deaminase [Daejeonella lutea]|uniref:Cytidine deaminase n=1 Tax=Daejeonella lutea TaxID=572036 RepID=A0A1T5ERI0_9SPHI|nr:cytidine deaminase [Daejeonella lutea]SKB86592.1 cytidine deaminase [Daejeonella lutea]
MSNKNITISYQEYSSIDDLNPEDRDLCKEATTAMVNSHSPYSEFRVGAAVRLESGKIVYGSNQENVAYPSGLCAERVALFTIGSTYPNDKILAMAITAQTDNFKIMHPVTSCGACLQVMAEYEKKQSHSIDVLFYCQHGSIIKTSGIESLLPFAFAETRLKK